MGGQAGIDPADPREKQPELFDVHVMFFAGEPDQTVEALVSHFVIERSAAIRLVTDVPVVVKRGVEPDVASDVVDVLTQMGAQVVLLPSALGVPSENDALELPREAAMRRRSSQDIPAARVEPAANERLRAPAAPRAEPAASSPEPPKWGFIAREELGETPSAQRRKTPAREPAFRATAKPATERNATQARAPAREQRTAQPRFRAAVEEWLEPTQLDSRGSATRGLERALEKDAVLAESDELEIGAPLAELEADPPSAELDTDALDEELELELGSQDEAPLDPEDAELDLGLPTPSASRAGAANVFAEQAGLIETEDGLSIAPLFDPSEREAVQAARARAPDPPPARVQPPPPQVSAPTAAGAHSTGVDLGLGSVPPLPDLGLGSVPPLPDLNRSEAAPLGKPPGAPLAAPPGAPPASARNKATARGAPAPPPPPPTGAAASEARQRGFYERTLEGAAAGALPSLSPPTAGGLPMLGGTAGTADKATGGARSGDAYWSARRAPQELEMPRPAQEPAAVSEPKPQASKSAVPAEAETSSESAKATRALGASVLELLFGIAVFALGVQHDSSIVLGTASPWMAVLHGVGLYAIGVGLLRAHRPHLLHVVFLLCAVGAAWGANEWLKPHFDYEARIAAQTLPTGAFVLSGGAEIELLDLQVLIADVETPVGRTIALRELVVAGPAEGDAAPDMRVFAGLEGAELGARDAEALVGRALPVLPRASAAELSSQVRVPGTPSPSLVSSGTLTLSSALLVDTATWRIEGTLELETGEGDEARPTKGKLRGRLVWE